MKSILKSVGNVLDAPIPMEEEMARAEAQLRNISGQASDGFFSQYGLWIFFVVVAAIVGIMLLMIAGRYRRQRTGVETQASPLFEFEGDDEMSDNRRYPADDGEFAEVIFDDPQPYATDAEADTVDHDEDSSPIDWSDEGETPFETVSADDIGDVEIDEAEVEHPNVVPLRSEETELETAELDEDDVTIDVDEEEPADEIEEEEPEQRRYSFAGGREKVENNATFVRPSPEPDLPKHGPYAAGLSTDDYGRPFVAPFIRDDIEKAERRQSQRIDSMRAEFTDQFEMLKSEQSSRLDLVISAIDRKLESLDKRHASSMPIADQSLEMGRNVTTLGQQVDRISSAIEGQGQRIRAITQILETRFAEVGLVHSEVKSVFDEIKSVRADLSATGVKLGAMGNDMDEVKEHFGRLERAILDRAAQDSAVTVRLADVIRGTLPEGSYSFGATLTNGETADCLISFDGLREKIAIDAGFPMEAFHELPSRDAVRRNLPQAKGAEDGFRRAILRAILEAADRCIAPNETADSCILFLPSEAAYTILHDRFPDLVRDSQRARVWLVSPSTLMGTLHLIRNLLPDADDLEQRSSRASAQASKKEEDERLRQEVTALRRRSAHLSEELERTRGTLRGLISSADQPVEDDDRPADDDLYASDYRDASVKELAEEMAEQHRFDGTPDWQQGSGREKKPTARFDDDRPDPLR
ncbi:DNA recombination protein RmuC [Parvularcula sp. LCG005]|uniref:DNA recombination protein RmuC n=1 Tax=Parvularcula sp. LCG005 TaxID=3078805 RepID=UPI00294269D7|nr:DNA recombination protein RmuC [Parvularcula sp. LCG005]WOI53123.1 DNA recombination protein RmuC [Parvularcula sp. LCG005]